MCVGVCVCVVCMRHVEGSFSLCGVAQGWSRRVAWRDWRGRPGSCNDTTVLVVSLVRNVPHSLVPTE